MLSVEPVNAVYSDVATQLASIVVKSNMAVIVAVGMVMHAYAAKAMQKFLRTLAINAKPEWGAHACALRSEKFLHLNAQNSLRVPHLHALQSFSWLCEAANFTKLLSY